MKNKITRRECFDKSFYSKLVFTRKLAHPELVYSEKGDGIDHDVAL
jgi:hypothetical protein